jgi:hypothetical protein
LFQSNEFKTPMELTLASDLHSTPANKNIGFPGWPEHNLDCVLVFGGSVDRRGLAPAPFFVFLKRVIKARQSESPTVVHLVG